MKKGWIIGIVVVLIIAVIVYMGRHQIKSMFGMNPAAPTPAPTSAMTASPSVVAPSNNIYTVKTNPSKGSYLADFDGKTLYVFDKDKTGVSNCYGACATLWPPYTSGAVAQGTFPANITVITRTGGGKQFAWMGKPLYYYQPDQKAGDVLGDGVGGVWHLVKP